MIDLQYLRVQALDIVDEMIGVVCRSTPGFFVRELTPAQLSRTIEQSLQAGAAEISLFSHRAVTDDHWSAVRHTLTELL